MEDVVPPLVPVRGEESETDEKQHRSPNVPYKNLNGVCALEIKQTNRFQPKRRLLPEITSVDQLHVYWGYV